MHTEMLETYIANNMNDNVLIQDVLKIIRREEGDDDFEERISRLFETESMMTDIQFKDGVLTLLMVAVGDYLEMNKITLFDFDYSPSTLNIFVSLDKLSELKGSSLEEVEMITSTDEDTATKVGKLLTKYTNVDFYEYLNLNLIIDEDFLTDLIEDIKNNDLTEVNTDPLGVFETVNLISETRMPLALTLFNDESYNLILSMPVNYYLEEFERMDLTNSDSLSEDLTSLLVISNTPNDTTELMDFLDEMIDDEAFKIIVLNKVKNILKRLNNE